MTVATMADRLLDAMGNAAARQYGGEPMSELAHRLPCAELAASAGATEELVLAGLLHDAVTRPLGAWEALLRAHFSRRRGEA